MAPRRPLAMVGGSTAELPTSDYVPGTLPNTRTVAASTTAIPGETLHVNASAAARTVTPPASPVAGDRARVVKNDTGPYPVTWSGTVSGDTQGVQLLAAGASATLVYDGAGWWLESAAANPSAAAPATPPTVDYPAYGDVLITLPRLFATNSTATTLGSAVASGVVAPLSGTATKLRIGGAAAPTGTGTLTAAVYTGSDTANLTQVATVTALTAVAASTLYDLPLSATVTWAAGTYVYVAFLATGWTAAPSLRSATGGGPGSSLLNPTVRLGATSTATNLTTLPTTLNLTTGYSGNSTLHWWALA